MMPRPISVLIPFLLTHQRFHNRIQRTWLAPFLRDMPGFGVSEVEG